MVTNASTVNNFGTITAETGARSAYDAVAFATYFSGNRVITNPGAVFDGTVAVGGGVLELASSPVSGRCPAWGRNTSTSRRCNLTKARVGWSQAPSVGSALMPSRASPQATR